MLQLRIGTLVVIKESFSLLVAELLMHDRGDAVVFVYFTAGSSHLLVKEWV